MTFKTWKEVSDALLRGDLDLKLDSSQKESIEIGLRSQPEFSQALEHLKKIKPKSK